MQANIENHLRALIQLSVIDKDFGEPESNYIYTIAKANKIDKEQVDALVTEVLKEKEDIRWSGREEKVGQTDSGVKQAMEAIRDLSVLPYWWGK